MVDLFDSFVTAGGRNLVRAWSATAQYQHWWSSNLRSTLFGGYLGILMPGAATAAGHPDFRLWQLGFNTIWSPAAGLDVSGEVVYTDMTTTCGNLGPAACAADPTRGKHLGIVGGLLRTRRNF